MFRDQVEEEKKLNNLTSDHSRGSFEFREAWDFVETLDNFLFSFSISSLIVCFIEFW